MEFGRQFGGENNGRLLGSKAHLVKRGWTSTDVITRAKRELLEAGFIFETVKGQRPNKASWYAVTWRSLDKCKGYDFGSEKAFERGAYLKGTPLKIDALRPSDGLEAARIGPSDGLRRSPTRPPDGPIRAVLDPRPRPPDGHLLEEPSACNVSTTDEGNANALVRPPPCDLTPAPTRHATKSN